MVGRVGGWEGGRGMHGEYGERRGRVKRGGKRQRWRGKGAGRRDNAHLDLLQTELRCGIPYSSRGAQHWRGDGGQTSHQAAEEVLARGSKGVPPTVGGVGWDEAACFVECNMGWGGRVGKPDKPEVDWRCVWRFVWRCMWVCVRMCACVCAHTRGVCGREGVGADGRGSASSGRYEPIGASSF